MPESSLRVVRVATTTEEREFLELPYALYRRDRNWVAPLRRDEKRRWSTAHNPSLRNRSAARFIAIRHGRVVGRIAAIEDAEFARRWASGSGFFGFYECAEDIEASAALFDAAHDWLRAQGATSVIGPINVSTHDETGFLVSGFDSPPMILSPYNPARYAEEARAAGYSPARDYHSYLWRTGTASVSPAVERLVRAARARGARNRVTMRAARPKEWDEEVRVLFDLYNRSFNALWGFVPITWEEFSARAADFRPIYRPELVVIGEVSGAPAGFGLILPDVNAGLIGLDGRLLPFGWIRVMRKMHRPRSARFVLAGVAPEYTGLGIAALISYELQEAVMKIGIERIELSLVQERNTAMRHVIDAFGCPPCKTYRLFERGL